MWIGSKSVRSCSTALSTLQAAAGRGEVPPLQPAMLEDRIRTFEGRPQRYGTQFDWDADGELSPLPIEDPTGLDDRRRALGLGPLEDELMARRAMAQSPERSPGLALRAGAKERKLA